jgi:hypothetical protein
VNQAIDQIINRIRRGWTKGANARNKDGESCMSVNGVSWCVRGAMYVEDLDLDIVCKIVIRFNTIHGTCLEAFNDAADNVEQVVEALEKCKIA